jgi:hypothetical protein
MVQAWYWVSGVLPVQPALAALWAALLLEFRIPYCAVHLYQASSIKLGDSRRSGENAPRSWSVFSDSHLSESNSRVSPVSLCTSVFSGSGSSAFRLACRRCARGRRRRRPDSGLCPHAGLAQPQLRGRGPGAGRHPAHRPGCGCRLGRPDRHPHHRAAAPKDSSTPPGHPPKRQRCCGS